MNKIQLQTPNEFINTVLLPTTNNGRSEAKGSKSEYLNALKQNLNVKVESDPKYLCRQFSANDCPKPDVVCQVYWNKILEKCK